MSEKKKAGGTNVGKYNQTGKKLHKPTYPYADKKEPSTKAETLSKEIEKSAPNAVLKSTILAQKGLKDIASVVAQFDPKGSGIIAPQMYPMLQQIFTAMAAGGGGNGSGSERSPPNPAAKKVVEDALTGALSILANSYSFEQIIETFNTALSNNGINIIDKEYRNIVKNALANLYTNYTLYGPGNLPYFVPSSVVTEIGTAPSPVVTIVPDLYVQQYYYPSLDPYPGYIKWILPQEDFTDPEVAVFTVRKIGDPYYVSADEEIHSLSEQELAKDLEPYIQENNLTARILNDLLVNETVVVENNKKEKTTGKNSSKNVISLLIQMAGYAGQITKLQQALHLPLSVLSTGAIQKSQTKFMENIGKLKDMKKKGKQAATPIAAAAMLGAPVLSSVVSSITSNPAVASVTSSVSTAQTLYNIIKS